MFFLYFFTNQWYSHTPSALSPETYPLNSESGRAFVTQMKMSVGEEEWRQGIKEERMDWAEGIACAKALGWEGTRQAWWILNTSVWLEWRCCLRESWGKKMFEREIGVSCSGPSVSSQRIYLGCIFLSKKWEAWAREWWTPSCTLWTW